MTKARHTPGPWKADTNLGCKRISAKPFARQQHKQAKRMEVASTSGLFDDAEDQANANLIAAAPDHALIGWAMCVGVGSWESLGDGDGEFFINGICHSTKLDQFGVPVMTDAMRAALSRAKGQG